MTTRSNISLRWVGSFAAGASIYLVAMLIAPSPIIAQANRAAVLLRGAETDASVSGAVAGVLVGRGYEVMSDEAVRSAMAFAEESADDSALARLLGVAALVIVETRPDPSGLVNASVTLLDPNGRRQEFGQVAHTDLASFVIQHLGSWNTAPAPSGAAGMVSPSGPAPAPTGAAAPPPPASPVVSQPVVGPQHPIVPPMEEEPRPRRSPLVVIGAIGLAVGLAAYLTTPIVLPLMCEGQPGCNDYIGWGAIPFAGPWLAMANPPSLGWEEGHMLALATLGVLQDALIPVGAILLIVGMARRRRARRRDLTFLATPTMDGGVMGLSASF